MTERPNEPSGQNALSEKPAVTIDWRLYAEHLDDSDLTDDQKREFIETLWSIVLGFIDLGYNIHPLQQVDAQPANHDACDQNDEIRSIIASGMVNLEEFPTIETTFLSDKGKDFDSQKTEVRANASMEKGEADDDKQE